MFQLQLHQKDIQYSTYLQQMQSNTNDWWSIQSVSRMCTMVDWWGFNGTLGTNRPYHATEVGNVSHRAGGEHKYRAIK